MNLDQLLPRFERLAKKTGCAYRLGKPATEDQLKSFEQRVNASIPKQVRSFYEAMNGFSVAQPHIEIFSIENVASDSGGRLYFAIVANDQRLYFEAGGINEAGQWNIVTEDGNRITLTMASFWSNKIWSWLERKKEFWKEIQDPSPCVDDD